MEASAIPEVKAALARVTLEEAKEAVVTAFTAITAQELEEGLAERFAPRLADLLDQGDVPVVPVSAPTG